MELNNPEKKSASLWESVTPEHSINIGQYCLTESVINSSNDYTYWLEMASKI